MRLLDNLSNDQHGRSAYVKPEEDIETKVASLYSKIKNPVMSDIAMTLEYFRLRDRQPSDIGDLFEGDQIVQVGRLSPISKPVSTDTARIKANLIVGGVFEGSHRDFKYPVSVDLRNRRSSFKFVEKLWAQRRVAFLLNEVRLKGKADELVDEIVDLATRYGIITPYTSYLADENQRLSNISGLKRDVASKSRALHDDTRGIAAQEEAITMQTEMTVTQPGFKVDHERQPACTRRS